MLDSLLAFSQTGYWMALFPAFLNVSGREGTNGRPGKKGARRPTLQRRLTDSQSGAANQHGGLVWGTTRTVELASETAIWSQNGLPPVPIRWVLIRDPLGQFEPLALLCTQQDASAQRILARLCTKLLKKKA